MPITEIAPAGPLEANQIKKLNILVDKAEMDFESSEEQQASIYRLYSKRYGITIYHHYIGDKEFTVLDSNTNNPITGTALDKVLNEIADSFKQNERTLERVPNLHDGKIQTITTTANPQPKARLIDSILANSEIKLTLEQKVNAAKAGMQKVYSALEGKSDLESMEYLYEIESMLKHCQNIVAEQYKKRNAKAHSKILALHNAAAGATTKSKIRVSKAATSPATKMSKEDKAIWAMLPANASPEQFAKAKARYQAMMALTDEPLNVENGKIRIATTETTEIKYNQPINGKDQE